jgi:purine-binding chemotaxis protein CheW
MSENLIDEDEKVLLKRAEALSKAITFKELESEKIDFLCFSVNNVNYAIEKTYTEELHLSVTPTKIPCTPTFIKGIVNIRGEILSVTDISLFLGNKPIQERSSYPMIRIKSKDRPSGKLEFGFVVDEIDDILSLTNTDIYQNVVSGNSQIEKFLKGLTRDMVHILNMEKILNDEIIIDES